MDCFPTCDVYLGETGTASVRSKFNVCNVNSPTLTLGVKSGGKFTINTFLTGNGVEIRPIRNNRWELHLRVNFRKTSSGHHAEACFENARTGNLTCFMNTTLHGDSSACIPNNQANSDFLWVLLCIILITCALFIGISVFTIMSRFNSQKASNFRKPNKPSSMEKIAVSRKSSRDQEKSANREPNVCLLSPNYYFDERLAVIAEVDEKDHQSEASNFESNNSINQRLENEKRKFSTDSGTELSAVVAAVQKNSLLYQKGVRYLELS